MISLTRLTIARAREERLAQVAGSLTFTTLLSIVPFLAVSFALFTRFPEFKRFEKAIEDYLLKSLLPADISRTVLKNLTQFADNANGLTVLGSLFILATAMAMMLTVENALNQIWQVRRGRPILRRVGLYLLMLAAASDAVPTPASTMTGTCANSLMMRMLFGFWMPRPEPIGAPRGITAAAPASSSLRHTIGSSVV